MTMVDFYKVISETDKTAVLEKIGQKETSTGFLTGTTLPDEKENVSSPETLRVYKRVSSGELKMVSNKQGYRKVFYEWDGEPKRFNHCD